MNDYIMPLIIIGFAIFSVGMTLRLIYVTEFDLWVLSKFRLWESPQTNLDSFKEDSKE